MCKSYVIRYSTGVEIVIKAKSLNDAFFCAFLTGTQIESVSVQEG